MAAEMKFKSIPMDSKLTQNNLKKRKTMEHSETSESKVDWPKFIVITADDKALAKASPFLIDKSIQSVAGTVKHITKQRNGNLLVECDRQQQSVNLLKCKHIGDIEVKVFPHTVLNTSKGILRDKDKNLHLLADDVILNNLKDQGVIGVRRFIIKREGKEIKTHTFLLTFNTPTVPPKIKLGYIIANVDFYYPAPLRCYSCQKFGHGSSNCRGHKTCVRCAYQFNCTDDDDNERYLHLNHQCTATPKCANCKGNHSASSKECPIYKRESEIIKIKVEKRMSYPDARTLYNKSQEITTLTNTYASVITSKKTSTVACQTDISGINTNLDTSAGFQSKSKILSKSSSSSQTQIQLKPESKKSDKKSKKPPPVPVTPELEITNSFNILEVEMEDVSLPSSSATSSKEKHLDKTKSKNRGNSLSPNRTSRKKSTSRSTSKNGSQISSPIKTPT